MSSETKPVDNSEEVPKMNLLEVEITDENVALNVLVGFLGLAQRRGVFAINESAKIYEAVKKFKSTDSPN
tara:strand:+ start:10700 stop:10909 length:210 start_codon:yes stop_codon:yes gene_type:complete